MIFISKLSRKQVIGLIILLIILFALPLALPVMIWGTTSSRAEVRKRAVTGEVTPTPSPETCDVRNFKMAFILVTKNPQDATQDKMDKINKIKGDLSPLFSAATHNLAQMDTSYPLKVIVDNPDDSFVIERPGEYDRLDLLKMARRFYENNGDDFHFLTVYSTFRSSGGYHLFVRNKIKGIGRQVFDQSNSGSKEKLLGINHMDSTEFIQGNINDDAGWVLHETGHQWCCYLGNNFDPNNITDLPIREGYIHWYPGFSVNEEALEPMNARYFWPNGDGTYRAQWQYEGDPRFHPFQLYFMGLLKPDEIKEKFTVYNVGMPPNDVNLDRATAVKDISIQDLIKVGGERSCYTSPTPTPTPTPPPSFPLSSGWNQITWSDIANYTAKTALEDINSDCGTGTALAIARKNKDWWEDFVIEYEGKNFNLQNGQNYFINVSKGCNWVP